jgi:serine O-acetyltransferase
MDKEKGPFKIDREKYYRIQFGTVTPHLSQKLALWITHFGFHCVIVYRIGKYAKGLYGRNRLAGLPLVVIFKFLNYFGRMIHHVDISDATIGPGMHISHASTIYIGEIPIGRNFSLGHNVTIGIGHQAGKVGMPKSIGDDVWIGTGSVIAGAITIGNHVTIASGSILSKDIPDNALVMGNPARVIDPNYDNTHLL